MTKKIHPKPLTIRLSETVEAVRIGCRQLKGMLPPQKLSESWRVQTEQETLTQVTLFGSTGSMIHWRSTTPARFHDIGDKLAVLRNTVSS